MIILLTLNTPCVVDGRVLASEVKENKAKIVHQQPIQQLNLLRGASSSVKEEENKDKPQENKSSRVLIENEFHTMASGPSRRGSGH